VRKGFWRERLALALVGCVLACSKEEPAGQVPAVSGGGPPLAPPPQVSSAPSSFSFPGVPARAKEGDYVLAPAFATLQGIEAQGLARHTVIYYGGWMRQPGEERSLVESLAKQTRPIPNAAIIPIAPGQRAEPGDVVLTSWASGSGMQRAVVVEGGTPEEPVVRYLDMALENPSGWGERTDKLKRNTFAVLTQPGEPGTTAACREGERLLRYIVTRRFDAEVLALGFAGKLRLLQAGDCEFLPVRAQVERGQHVLVPYLGRFVESEVFRVKEGLGRVVVRRKMGGKRFEQAVPVTDIQPQP
jgi:hypothetical protein